MECRHTCCISMAATSPAATDPKATTAVPFGSSPTAEAGGLSNGEPRARVTLRAREFAASMTLDTFRTNAAPRPPRQRRDLRPASPRAGRARGPARRHHHLLIQSAGGRTGCAGTRRSRSATTPSPGCGAGSACSPTARRGSSSPPTPGSKPKSAMLSRGMVVNDLWIVGRAGRSVRRPRHSSAGSASARNRARSSAAEYPSLRRC